MNTQDFETLGFYEPGFLHLRINTDFDIFDLYELSRNEDTKQYFSTFLHEYVHFLQDVSTPSGLMSSSFYIDFIKDVNWTVRNDGKSDFDVPVDINNKNNIDANIKLRALYRGDAEGPELVKYDYYLIENESIADKDGNVKNPKKYKVFYHDLRTREYKSFYFGSACLKEYVAHTIQAKYISSTSHNDIPYLIAEQVIIKECPTFGNDTLNILALCDACLMCFHPAEMFFNTIERIKKEGFAPKQTKDVYDFAYFDLSFQGQIGTFTVETLFEEIVSLADRQFKDALQADVFLPNYNWVKHILIKAKELRLNHPNFMTELVDGEGKLSNLFYDIFRLLGTPFFTNLKAKGGFVPPNDLKELPSQPYQLLVFKQIINIYNGDKHCSLFAFCKSRPDKDLTNQLCQISPWERATEADLCPFGQLWRTWGLTGEIPVHK
jgi:hypothetical protein